MKNKKILTFLILLLIFCNFKLFAMTNVFVVYKIENQIITNIDIENESKYLMALNTQLKNLDQKKILKIAKESIIKEIIKKIELLKYYNLDQKNEFLDIVIKDFYLKLQLNNKVEFQKYLNDYNLTINDVKKKIEIESTWNQMIYQRYKNQINIDNNALKKRINLKKQSTYKKKYLLSEIVFDKDRDQSLNEKTKKIYESINEIGFKNTANIYSVSDSSKFGGNVGWIEEGNLSNKLSNIIKELELGNYSKTFQINNSFIIIKLENMKKEIIEVDEKKELEKMILFEQNRQLEQFSKIYYNKIRINTNISEL